MHLRLRSAQKGLVGLLFLVILLGGLMTAEDYGRPWDEGDEMSILRMNLWEYVRALHLDESAFFAWAEREDDPLIAPPVPIGDSLEQDHGAAAFYPLAGVVMDEKITGHDRSTLWHMGCWALFTLGLFALYACCRELGLPRWAGALGSLFLLASPRFFAQGHYNNKDIALLALTLCALWQGLRLMRKPTMARAFGFALAGAFAANMKVAGLALWALMGLFILGRQIAYKNVNKRVVGVGLTALGAFAVFYALLTPALWRNPAGFVGYLVQNALAFGRWENYVRFRGATFFLAKERLPWYYLPYMMLATTPVFVTLLAAAGQVLAGKKMWKYRRAFDRRDDLWGLGLCSCLWQVPLGFALITRTTVYNGWRHFYFLYGPLVILAAWGAYALFRRLRGRDGLRRTLAAAIALCLAVTAAGIAGEHPYEYAYYQPVLRAFTQADDLELDYWNVSVANALGLLGESREGTLRMGWADLWAEAGLRRTLPSLNPLEQERFVLTEEAPDYVLVNPTYALYSGFAPEAGWRVAVSIASYGRVIMVIYETHPNANGGNAL